MIARSNNLAYHNGTQYHKKRAQLAKKERFSDSDTISESRNGLNGQNGEFSILNVENISFGCESCNENFETNKQLMEHIASVHDEKKLQKCFICNEEFSTKKIAEEHLTKWENGVLKCWTGRSNQEQLE